MTTLRVDPDSFHYRIYLWWLNDGYGNPEGYRENLCHYMRTIFLTWFFRMPIFWILRPYEVVVALSGVLLFLLKDSAWFIVAVLLAANAMVRLIVHDVDHGDRFARSLEWFVLAGHGVIRPWIVLSVVGFIVLSLSIGVVTAVTVFGAIMAVVLGAVVVCAIVVGVFTAVVWTQKKISTQFAAEGDEAPRYVSFLRLVGAYIMARKRKICPWIILPE